MNPRGGLKPARRKLIVDFSDRFTIHSDNFYAPPGAPVRGPNRAHELANRLLDQRRGKTTARQSAPGA